MCLSMSGVACYTHMEEVYIRMRTSLSFGGVECETGGHGLIELFGLLVSLQEVCRHRQLFSFYKSANVCRELDYKIRFVIHQNVRRITE